MPTDDNELARLIGKNMAERRRKLGLTQAQLSERLGVEQETLSRMEKGVITPKISRLRHFSQELCCSVPDLFRENTDDTNIQAAAIADIIRPLSPPVQAAVVRIVSDMVHVMREGAEK